MFSQKRFLHVFLSLERHIKSIVPLGHLNCNSLGHPGLLKCWPVTLRHPGGATRNLIQYSRKVSKLSDGIWIFGYPSPCQANPAKDKNTHTHKTTSLISNKSRLDSSFCPLKWAESHTNHRTFPLRSQHFFMLMRRWWWWHWAKNTWHPDTAAAVRLLRSSCGRGRGRKNSVHGATVVITYWGFPWRSSNSKKNDGMPAKVGDKSTKNGSKVQSRSSSNSCNWKMPCSTRKSSTVSNQFPLRYALAKG